MQGLNILAPNIAQCMHNQMTTIEYDQQNKVTPYCYMIIPSSLKLLGVCQWHHHTTRLSYSFELSPLSPSKFEVVYLWIDDLAMDPFRLSPTQGQFEQKKHASKRTSDIDELNRIEQQSQFYIKGWLLVWAFGQHSMLVSTCHASQQEKKLCLFLFVEYVIKTRVDGLKFE